MTVRMFVDAWDPSYGSGLDRDDNGPDAASTAQIRSDVELPESGWHPLSPPPDVRAPDVVLFVDGVRRKDAQIWVEEDATTLHPGLAASYAAGVVRCDLRAGSAEVIGARVERALFTPSSQAHDLVTTAARYTRVRVDATEPAHLDNAVQPRMQALEADAAATARQHPSTGDDLLVLDGPLRERDHLPRTLGYVKSHHKQYLSAQLSTVVTSLRAGQRTPVFALGTNWQRYSWYLRLPGPAGSPWAGVVRVEASAELTAGEVIRLADRSAVTLPRFASSPYKDSRAPQNLTPIAGLERRLRAMLGDSRLLHRSLVAAASSTVAAAASATVASG